MLLKFNHIFDCFISSKNWVSLSSFEQVLFLLMINWFKLPKIDLTVATVISLETAGFIGNKYTHFYGFAYMFIVIFLS